MFTGIIQAIGQVRSKNMHDKKGAVFSFCCNDLDLDNTIIGDSIAVNGVCLTVIELDNNGFKADVSQETLNLSVLSDLSVGDDINLEKALRLNQGIDGHLVSGHVDGRGEVVGKTIEDTSTRFKISTPKSLVKYIAKKGSITLNGVSLTINNIKSNIFDVNIVSHTLTATTMGQLNVGSMVNLEVDIIAKHLEQLTINS